MIQFIQTPSDRFTPNSALPPLDQVFYSPMSNSEISPASLPSSSSSSSLCSISVPDIDPLLKDLNERKQSFRRNVVSLAAELKEVRSRLASQEQIFAKETITRQACRLWLLVLFVFCVLYFGWTLRTIVSF